MIASLILAAFVSKPDIPENVLEVFNREFPDADNVQWTKKRGIYTANLVYDGNIISISFDDEGNITSALCEINFEGLPDPIAVNIRANYPDYKTIIVWQVFRRGKIVYEIELAKGEIHYVLQYNNKERLTNRFEIERRSTDLTMVN